MFDFSWRAVVLTLLCLAFGLYVYGQTDDERYTLAIGAITANDQEQQECYFAFGGVNAVRAAVVSFHPQNEACIRARELVGRTGRLVFVPDAP